jgi:hypothetical protein
LALSWQAALIAHTTDLELVIRHVLAGLGQGIHAGRERGAGVEFSEYRAYAPGRRVAPRRLEAAGARRPLLCARGRARQPCRRLAVLDASASMLEPSRSIAGLDKLGYRAHAAGLRGRDRAAPGRRLRPGRLSGRRAHFTRPRAGRASCSACWPS